MDIAKKNKKTELALAISIALISCHSYAADRIVVGAGQQEDLTPGRHYLNDGLENTNSSVLLMASNGGIINGLGGNTLESRITLDSHRTDLNTTAQQSRVAWVSSGAKIYLKNVDIYHRNSSSTACNYSSNCSPTLSVTGTGSVLDISNARIETFSRPIHVTGNAVATIRDTEFFIENNGLYIERGNTLSISDSYIHQNNASTDSMGAAINILYSGKLEVFNSQIEARTLGVYTATTNIYFNDPTPEVKLRNTDITISREGSAAGKGIYLASFSRYANSILLDAHNVTITTQGNDRSINNNDEDQFNSVGIFARNSQTMSYFRGDSPEDAYIRTRDNDTYNVYMFAGSHITLENSGIYLEGDRSTGLYADHNNGLFSPHNPIANSYTREENTTITAQNINMTISGNDSFGAVAQSADSKITIGDMQLNSTGNNVTGLWAKTLGSELNASRVNAEFSGHDSIGMKVDNGATATLNHSQLSMTGERSHGVIHDFLRGTNTISMEDNRIETQDGYAILNKNGKLDLTLERTILTGRAQGENGTAIYIDNTRSNNASNGTVRLNNNSIVSGDIKLDATNATVSPRLDVQMDHSKVIGNIILNSLNSRSSSTLSVGLRNNSYMAGDILLNETHSTNSNTLTSTDLSLDNSYFIGNISANTTARQQSLSVSLTNNSSITSALSNIDLLSLDETSTWYMTDNSTVSQFDHRGNVIFNAPDTAAQTYPVSSFKTLTVNGDYQGTGGLFTINTALAGDDSLTDKITINGNTSGEARLRVLNFGNSSGDYTTNGIEVITVNGQRSEGNFTLEGRALAGAFEYFLHQNNQTGNWYLASQLAPIPPDPIPDPEPTPEPDPAPEPTPNPLPPDVTPNPAPEPTPTPVYRPEAGGYLANIAAANKLFTLRLEDREGRAENTSMWLRQVAARNQFRDSSDQLRAATNRFVTQLGGEVWQTRLSHRDRLGFGVMAAYGRADSETRSKLHRHFAKSTVDGYSIGLYSTWYQNADSLNGIYLDSWLQYSWLNAEVNGEGQATERYHINGFTASLETGYRLPLSEYSDSRTYLTPQAQVIWQGIKADSHYESATSTMIKSPGNNTIQTRLGIKLSLDGVNSEDKGTDKLFTLYTEANWLYNSKQAEVSMNDVTFKQSGNRHVGEVKLGFEGQLNKNVHLWANVAQQIGTKGYKDTAATFGVKYQF